MTGLDCIVRTMSRQEVDLAVEWAAREGWNPGLHDAHCFYATDPHGFFVGTLNGEPVGCISAVTYGNFFGFLGFYIVRQEFRGRGFGLKIWQKGMEYLGNRNIGLDGVVAQQPNYKKSGFQLAYRNIRYEGVGKSMSRNDSVELSDLPFDDLVAYDTMFFPTCRKRFLQYWIKQPDCHALGVLKNSKLSGYGVLRPCRNGFKIGPLFADDEHIAEDLFQALASHGAGQSIYLDTPEANAGAISMAQRHGMKVVFETARMYTKNPPNLPLSKIFGVTTFELG